MKYEITDLDYIFIRALNKQDKWDNVSLNEVSDGEFLDWVEKRFGIRSKNKNQRSKTWTSQQKVDLLNFMSEFFGYPIVSMTKRESRKDFKNN